MKWLLTLWVALSLNVAWQAYARADEETLRSAASQTKPPENRERSGEAVADAADPESKPTAQGEPDCD